MLFGFVQVRVSEWLLVILPSPILELQHTLLTLKCYKPGSMPQLFIFSLFSLQTHIWIYQGASERVNMQGEQTCPLMMNGNIQVFV
jgi:hypothetical protein